MRLPWQSARALPPPDGPEDQGAARRSGPLGLPAPPHALCFPAMKLLFKWLLSASALLLVAYLYSGVEVRSFSGALMAALVIGLFIMWNGK